MDYLYAQDIALTSCRIRIPITDLTTLNRTDKNDCGDQTISAFHSWVDRSGWWVDWCCPCDSRQWQYHHPNAHSNDDVRWNIAQSYDVGTPAHWPPHPRTPLWTHLQMDMQRHSNMLCQLQIVSRCLH